MRIARRLTWACFSLVGLVGGCRTESRADDAPTSTEIVAPTRAAPSAIMAAAPNPSAAVAPLKPTLTIPCLSTTWADLRAGKAGKWQKQDCGSYALSYRYYAASGSTPDSLNVIVRVPLNGKQPAAVVKDAVTALLPNVGDPGKSVGGCDIAPDVRALTASNPGLRNTELGRVKAQGGYRAAEFDVDGLRLIAELAPQDENTPGTASIIVKDGAELQSGYPPVAWQSTSLCR